MALLDDDLTGETLISARIKAAMGVIGFWLLVVGGVLAATFAIGSLFMFYFVYDAATSSYFRVYNLGTALGMLLLCLVGAYGGVLLLQAGASIRKYMRERDQQMLEAYFDKQKLFWIIAGVASVLYGLGILFLLVMFLIDYLD